MKDFGLDLGKILFFLLFGKSAFINEHLLTQLKTFKVFEVNGKGSANNGVGEVGFNSFILLLLLLSHCDIILEGLVSKKINFAMFTKRFEILKILYLKI